MKRQLRLAAITVAVLVLLAAVLRRGRDWRVETSVVAAATPSSILPLISDLDRGWRRWSAWPTIDPKGKWEYGGRPGEQGHFVRWQGPALGRGKLALTRVDSTGIEYDAAIESETTNAHGSIVLAPEAGRTRVTWVDEGQGPPLLGVLIRRWIERELAERFEQDLARLARSAERAEER
jgi:hypothetical protein